MIASRPVLIAAGLAAVVLGLYVWRRGGIGNAAAGAGSAAVDAADGFVSGVVTGLGERVGIPRTSETECDRALRAGDTWRASFACPAGTFIAAQWRRATEPAVDGSILDPRDARARRPADSATGAGANVYGPPPPWDGAVIDGSQTWWVAP